MHHALCVNTLRTSQFIHFSGLQHSLACRVRVVPLLDISWQAVSYTASLMTCHAIQAVAIYTGQRWHGRRCTLEDARHQGSK